MSTNQTPVPPRAPHLFRLCWGCHAWEVKEMQEPFVCPKCGKPSGYEFPTAAARQSYIEGSFTPPNTKGT